MNNVSLDHARLSGLRELLGSEIVSRFCWFSTSESDTLERNEYLDQAFQLIGGSSHMKKLFFYSTGDDAKYILYMQCGLKALYTKINNI